MAMDNVKAVISKAHSDQYDTRYVLINADTGEVLDDAQGYGYKTAQKAYACWAYKNRSPNKKTLESQITRWLKENGKLCKELENAAWYAFKDNEQFSKNDVAEILQNYNVPPDFKPADVLRVWNRL